MKVTNYEISTILKELGFKAETNLYWIKCPDDYKNLYIESNDFRFRSVLNLSSFLDFGYVKDNADMFNVYPSYCLEAILDALPKVLDKKSLQISYRAMINLAEFRYISIQDNIHFVVRQLDSEDLVDTAARLLIKLIREGKAEIKSPTYREAKDRLDKILEETNRKP